MGLKPKSRFQSSFLPLSSCNRTIMGLKRRRKGFTKEYFYRLQSNHYGIETNRRHQGTDRRWGKVAIEPLWDWNTQSSRSGSSSTCCNRTIMGLKLRNATLSPSFLSSLQSNHYGIETKNKFEQGKNFAEVAIEPLWDWNLSFLYNLLIINDKLQSNHYGIETIRMA